MEHHRISPRKYLIRTDLLPFERERSWNEEIESNRSAGVNTTFQLLSLLLLPSVYKRGCILANEARRYRTGFEREHRLPQSIFFFHSRRNIPLKRLSLYLFLMEGVAILCWNFSALFQGKDASTLTRVNISSREIKGNPRKSSFFRIVHDYKQFWTNFV